MATTLTPARSPAPRVIDALATDDAQRRHNEERAAAFRDNPRCVVCEQPITDARIAFYIPALDRFACPGDHSMQALDRLWQRINRFGGLVPRGAR